MPVGGLEYMPKRNHFLVNGLPLWTTRQARFLIDSGGHPMDAVFLHEAGGNVGEYFIAEERK